MQAPRDYIGRNPTVTTLIGRVGGTCCVLVGLFFDVGCGAGNAFAAPVTVDTSLSVSERYDNNLYLSQTDPVSDLTTTVSPRIDVTFDHRPVQGSLSYQASAEWYRQRRTENRLSHQGEARAALKALRRVLPNLDVQVAGLYSVAGELPGTTLSGLPSEPGGQVLLPRTETTQWRGGATAGYQWTRRFESRLEYALTTTRYQAFNLAELADVVAGAPALTVATHNSVTHDATLALRYRRSATTTLTLNPGWRAIRVDTEEETPTADNTTVTSRLTVGAEYFPGAFMTVRGQVGAMVVEDDQTRLVFDIRLHRSWARGGFSLSGGQEAGAGGGVTGTASITQRGAADLSYVLGTRTQSSLGLTVARHVSIADDPSITSVRIMTYGANAGLTRGVFQWLTASLNYSYTVQRSDGVSLDGERHVVTATLTTRTPSWRIP